MVAPHQTSNAVEASRAIVGSLILWPKAREKHLDTIDSILFPESDRLAIEALKRLKQRGEEITAYTVAAETGDKIKAGDLTALTTSALPATSIPAHVKILREAAAERKAASIPAKVSAARRNGKNARAIVEELQQEVGEVEKLLEPSKADLLDPAKIMEAFAMTEKYVDRLGEEEFLFPDLIIRNHVLTVIAMPGGGKTTYMFFHVAPTLAKQGLKVWYIDADSPASNHKRMKQVADEHGFKILNPDVNDGTSMEGLVASLRTIADSGADLTDWVLFVDTLKKAANLMNKGDVKSFYQLARKLANLGATIVLLGHANKFRDKEGNLVFEGVGDVRADSDEMIFFERKTNPDESLDVTTVVDPDRGAKVRGSFRPFSFHISPDRSITHYKEPLPTIDRTITKPKATDDEIVQVARKYLFAVNVPIGQTQLVHHVSDMTATGKERVRQVIVQHSEPKNAMIKKGLPIAYSIGKKNSHVYEVAE